MSIEQAERIANALNRLNEAKSYVVTLRSWQNNFRNRRKLRNGTDLPVDDFNFNSEDAARIRQAMFSAGVNTLGKIIKERVKDVELAQQLLEQEALWQQ